jgi:hypothetical protein
MDQKHEGHWIADVDGSLDAADLDAIKEAFPELAEAIDELASKHGELIVCPTKACTCVFRVPKGAEYERFLGGLLDERKEQKVKAGKILAVATCVFPDRPTFEAAIAKYPGIPSACMKPLNKLMGGELVNRGKE